MTVTLRELDGMRGKTPLRHLNLLVLCALLATAATGALAEDSPFELVRVIVRGDGSAGPYVIGQTFIGGSAAVDTTLTATGIAVTADNPAAGNITFDRPLAEGDSAAVTLAVPPDWLRDTYRREDTPIPGAYQYSPPRSGPAPALPRATPGLTFGGTKTFDVNVGSEAETALNQTLRLNISGRLTEDITLNAAISDQNVPISPEGDTRELEELDRVLIEVKGPRFSAVMGDADLSHTGGRWLSYDRRLSGVLLGVTAGPVDLHGSGAFSEGRHMSTTITPVEGNQGPYRLVARDGRRDISLIPGTETIWINGEQLTRGGSYDYTIDYTTGEVFFTERRIIGADMRIVCDYEYSSESYLRNFYSAGARGEFLEGRLAIDFIAAREADNAGKPVLYDLSEEAKQKLRNSGDNPAVLSGIRSAEGDSSGTYDLVEDHYVYNPSGTGAFQVRFSWVGEDQGAYRYRGGGIYAFVPPGERSPGSGASYNPGSLIDGPVSQDLAGFTLSFDPSEMVHLEAELAGSSTDLNTLSPIGDGDNNGGAHRFGVSLSPEVTLGIPLGASLSASHRSQDSRFSSIDRDRAAEENRDWGLPIVTARQTETVSEYTAGLTVSQGILTGTGVTINGGSAAFGDSASVSRFGGTGRFVIGTRADASLRVNYIVRERYPGIPDEAIDRIDASLTSNLAGFRPAFRFEGERVEGTGLNTHGTLYNDYRTTLATPAAFGLTGEAEWFYRDERSKRVAWADSAFVRGGSLGLTTSAWQSGTFRARYSHRERMSDAGDVSTDQAVVDVSIRPDRGSYRFDGSYRAGRSQEASKRKNYIFIGTGRGQYRWEDTSGDGIRDQDEFIPDPHGSYYLYEETLEDYRPVNIVSTYGRLIIEAPGGVLERLIGMDLPLRSETSFDINEKSTAPSGDVFLLKLGQFRKQGTTIAGDARLQEDLTLPLSGGEGSVRLRYFRFDAFNAEYVTGAERRRQEEQSLRVRLPAGDRYDVECTITQAFSNRSMEERSIGDYRIISRSADAGVSFYPSGLSILGVTLGGGVDRDHLTSLSASYWQVTPTSTYRFSGRGRIELTYTLTRVSLSDPTPGARIPYPMARGQKAGTNHDISFIYDYRLSQRMTLIATYTGRKFGGHTFEHFARVQVRALF